MDLQALSDELANDPLGIGYAEYIDGTTGNINALRKLLNQQIVQWESGTVSSGVSYEKDDLRTYSGVLYRCLQDHTNFDETNSPDVAVSLWSQTSTLSDPPANRRTAIPIQEVYDQIDFSAYRDLSADDKDLVQMLTSTSQLDGTRSNVLSELENIFGSSSTTWNNISGILDEAGSRASAVVGEQVTNDDILQALSL